MVTNAGPSTVTGASVTDVFPNSLTGVTYTAAATGGATGFTSGTGPGNINDTVTMPSGSTITYTVHATVSPAATGTVSDTASVTAPAGVTDPTPANNTATDTDTVQIAQSTLAQIRLEVVDPVTLQPVTQLKVGDNFLLRGQVSDLRSLPSGQAGVFAAYLDVLYNSSLVAITGPITYTTYQNAESGDTTTPGAIDEVGASDGFTPLGPAEQLLFSLPLRATAFGMATFTADPAQLLPQHDVLEYGSNNPVPTSDVKYVSASVPIDSNSLSIADVSHNEGDSGTTPYVFTVTLSSASLHPVTVAYATADGTATVADNDYAGQPGTLGTLTFAPGTTTQTITIPVNGDTTFEANETFSVNLSSSHERHDRQGHGHRDDRQRRSAAQLVDQRRFGQRGGLGNDDFCVHGQLDGRYRPTDHGELPHRRRHRHGGRQRLRA